MRILTTFLITIIISCQPAEYSDNCTGTGTELTNDILDEKNGFSISLPTNFFVAEPYSYFELVSYDSSRVEDSIVTSLTVETYELNDNQPFDEFYKDIEERTQKAAKADTLNYEFHFTDDFTIGGRESKVSTVAFTAYGITLTTRTFYIKDLSTILTLTVATTNKQVEEEICKLMPSVNSLKKVEKTAS